MKSKKLTKNKIQKPKTKTENQNQQWPSWASVVYSYKKGTHHLEDLLKIVATQTDSFLKTFPQE